MTAPTSRVAACRSSFVLADFLIDHLHCENYLSYFDINLSWHQEVFKRIGGCIDDSQKFIFDEREFFECGTDCIEAGDKQDGHKVEVLDNPERFLRFCDRWLKPLEARCYAYDAAHFNLREITQVYDVLDLYLARRLWSVVRKGKVVAYAVAEAYSEGLNLFNLLDMCRVYFAEDHTDKQHTLKALIPQVEFFFRKFKKESFYVAFSLPHGDPHDLAWRGFEHRHSAGRVMMSRQGMVEYRTVLAMNSRQ